MRAALGQGNDVVQLRRAPVRGPPERLRRLAPAKMAAPAVSLQYPDGVETLTLLQAIAPLHFLQFLSGTVERGLTIYITVIIQAGARP